MADWQDSTLVDYRRKGFADRSGFGVKPALVVVDFINGFTDPSTPLGGDFASEIAVTRQILDAMRASGLPVAYTTVAYEPGFRDAGVFIKKVPALSILVKGSPMCEVDERIAPQSGEYVFEKKYASAFFGTPLDATLKTLGADTVIITGCTTSGCVRATAVDAMQHGYHTIVVADGVGDRARGPHEANLFDIDAKYGDVISGNRTLEYLRAIAGGDWGSQADDEFRRWWSEPSRPTAA